MKVADEVAWQGLLRDFANDPNPQAPLLRDFTIAWAEAAEKFMQPYETQREICDDWTNQLPIEALRATLRPTEIQGSERISVGVIGAALLLLSMHWEYGEGLCGDDMTQIEHRLVEDTALLKLMQLNAQAQESGNG